MYRAPARIILTGVILCLTVVPVWGDAKETYKAYQQLWARGKRAEACEILGEANTMRAAKMLVKILFQHLVEPKNEKPIELVARQKIITGCSNGFSKFTDKKVQSYLAKIAGRRALKPFQRGPFIRAFGKMGEAGAKLLITLRTKARDAEIKIRIAEAMDESKNPLLIDSWLKDLKSDYWMIQVYAIKSLARQRAKKAIPPLIGMLKHDHPKVSFWAHEALTGMTGTDLGTDKQDWVLWWKKESGKPLAGGGLGSKPKKPRGSVSLKVPTYYGLKFQSKRVAFVIDISGSMGELVKGNLKQPKKSPLDKRPASMRYDWSSIRNRLHLAQAHLVYTLAHLDPRTKFNIFIYSSNNMTWKENGWVIASRTNKMQAIERVKKLSAGGGTNIYEALQRAFNFPGKKPNLLDKSLKKGVDTIFLMTDGQPTSGTITQSSPEYRKRFVAAVERWNGKRKVKVHTIGVGEGHDGLLLSMIAKATGGTYTTAGTK